MKSMFLRALVCSCFSLAASLTPLFAQAKGEIKATIKATVKTTAAVAKAKSLDVEMLAGVAGGQVEVKFIPKNDREARLFIKNLTKEPLSVRLPDALAARPVLAQMNLGMGGPGGVNNPQANNTPQAMGVGAPRGNAAPRRAVFNIPPEHLVEVKVDTVCLEHGKKDPRPQVPYQLCRLDEVTAAAGVGEILKQLGAGTLDQRASQAAAWHLASGLSWDDLAAKRIEHLNEPSELYFTGDQLQTAQEAVGKAQEPGAKSERSVAASSSAESR